MKKVTAAKLIVESGVDYLKESTGFSNAEDTMEYAVHFVVRNYCTKNVFSKFI